MSGQPLHIDYYKFMDSFKGGKCPFCSYILGKKEGSFKHLIYEGINDKYLRRDFIQSGGFCTAHLREFLRFRDGLSVAVLYEQIYINSAAAAFERKPRGPDRDNQSCMLCGTIETWKRMYITLFKKHADDEDVTSAVQGSSGFCLPHFRLLREEIRHLPPWFEDFERSIFDGNIGLMRKYLESCSNPARTDDDKPSWKQVILSLLGEEGV